MKEAFEALQEKFLGTIHKLSHNESLLKKAIRQVTYNLTLSPIKFLS